jgi:ankyrin repeat protein
VDTSRYAALLFAAASGNAELVGVLLQAGAKADEKCKSGWTAADVADFYGYEELHGPLGSERP